MPIHVALSSLRGGVFFCARKAPLAARDDPIFVRRTRVRLLLCRIVATRSLDWLVATEEFRNPAVECQEVPLQ